MYGIPAKKPQARSDTPALGEHHDGSFKVYMQHKKSKLDTQFDKNFSYQAASPIFHGLSFWVDGYTDPPFEQLKLMVGQHGGHVDNYLSGSITHIIATNLPDSKVKQIREMKRWVPIVYPNWIVESVSAGKLLPHSKYVLPAFQERSVNSIGAALSRAAARPDSKPGMKLSSTGASPQTLMAPSKSSGGDPLFMEGYFSSSRLHFIGAARGHVQSIVAHGQRSLGLRAPRSQAIEGDDSSLLLTSPHSSFDATGPEDAGTPAPQTETEQALPSLASPVGWPKVIAHVDVDCFFAQVALLERPELKDLPVVIAHAGARPGGVGLHKKQTFGDGIDSSVTGAAVSLPGQSAVPFSVAGRDPVGSLEIKDDLPQAIKDHPVLAKLPPQAKFPNVFNGGEVSSANYPARKYGIQAGMTVMQAMELCPTLNVLPYNFQKITEVSESIFQ
jgi:DNA repair protein REV1